LLTRTSLALAFVVLAAACSSPAEDPPGGPAGTPTTSPTGTTAPPPPTPTGTGTTNPPGPTLTGVRVHYASSPAKPGAMTLRGSILPLSWDKSIPITTTKPGLFTWQIPGAKADIELKPMLGDTWSHGPNYKVKPGQTIDIYPHFFETHGTVTKKYPSFVSKKLPSTRGLWVYLPPTYVENTEARFGVLYMHDGTNLFDAALAFGGNEWKVDETMDAGAEDGTITETIVVGIESTANRISELTPSADPQDGGGHADDYIAMMIDEIKPMIDKDLRTVPARERTAIMGSSLGGLASAYAGVHRADVFGLVGEMSPSTWWDGTMILGEVSTTPTRPAKPIRVYVDSGNAGTSNDDVVNTTELAARYRKVGYTDAKDLLHIVQPGGQHNEFYWAQRLPAALHFLLGARPN
jgi:predicted alpha/beta superfamily hydrolase